MSSEKLQLKNSSNNYIKSKSLDIRQPCDKINSSQVCELLTPENKIFISPFDDHFEKYLATLGQVWRWQDHVYKDSISDFKESDFQHVLSMLNMVSEIKTLNLISINFDEVELMVLSHDGGEIITGDISQHNQKISKDEIEFIKDIETRVFSLILLKNGLNSYPKEKAHIRHLYNRYQKRNNNLQDTESHLVKLIDIFDGNTTGLNCVYKKSILFESYGDNPPKDPNEIIQNLIQKEIKQAEIVLNSINDNEDKQKLYDYLFKNHFSKFKNPLFGYQEIYKQYEDKLIALNPS